MKPGLPCGLIAIWLTQAPVLLSAAGFDTNSLSSTEQPSGDVTEVLLRMLGAFILVVSVFVVGAWLFKKSRWFSVYTVGGAAHLKILESRSLGYRNNLFVVGYDQHRFLLATSATGVVFLSALPNADTAEDPQDGARSFADQLRNMQGGRKADDSK